MSAITKKLHFQQPLLKLHHREREYTRIAECRKYLLNRERDFNEVFRKDTVLSFSRNLIGSIIAIRPYKL